MDSENKKFWLERASRGFSLRDFSAEAKRDRDIVMASVHVKGRNLKDAYKKFREDREVVSLAIESGGDSIEYASKELKKVRELVLKAVKLDRYGIALKHCPDFYDDREIVLEAVKMDGVALELASERLRGDKEIVLTAIRNRSNTGGTQLLRLAPISLQADKDIARAALWAGEDYQYVLSLNPAFHGDADLAKPALHNDEMYVYFITNSLRSDRNFMKEAICSNPSILNHAKEYQNDKDIALEASRLRPLEVMKNITEDLRNDPELVYAIVKENFASGEFVGKDLFNTLYQISKSPSHLDFTKEPFEELKGYRRCEFVNDNLDSLQKLVETSKFEQRLQTELPQKEVKDPMALRDSLNQSQHHSSTNKSKKVKI